MASNLAQTLAQLNIADEDDVHFEERVSKFPSSFDLELECIPKPRLQQVLDNLIEKLDNGFTLVDEEIQVYNLLSYMSFKLGNEKDAFGYNQKALDKDKKNGIALANRARYKKHQPDNPEARKILEDLEKLYKNADADVTRLVAKGELAQSYARFGPKFHKKAISKYESLFTTNLHIRNDLVILWKYDYSLCLRRTLNLFGKLESPESDTALTLQKACRTLVEIIDSSTDLPAYTARAWAELGQIVNQVERSPETFPANMLETIPLQKRFRSSEIYFKKALEIGNGDFDTMEACAKFMRHFGKAEEAVKLFERALKLRQSSLAYHHLALSMKKIEQKKVNFQKRQNQQRRFNHPGVSRGSKRHMVQTARQRELSNLKGGGRKATPLDWNEQTKQILETLEKACDKDPFNHAAAFDKAFLLRELSRYQEAKTELCKLLNILEIGELKISCYEQAAHCCLDLAEASTVDSEAQKFNGIRFLQKAIEVAAAVAAKVKYSSAAVRPLVPTVESMLTEPDLWETNNKQLERLKNLLIAYKDFLSLVGEARTSTACRLSSLVEKYKRKDQRDEAVMLSILKQVVAEPDEKQLSGHLTKILENASTCLADGDREFAVTMYQILVSFMGSRLYEVEKEYDLFALTDDEEDNLQLMVRVRDLLKACCGLNVVGSDESCSSGERLTEFSLSSAVVCLVLKNEKIDHVVECVVETVISTSPEKKPKIVILKDEAVKLPTALSNMPTVPLPPQRDCLDSEIASWLTDLFKAVIN